MYFIGAYIRNNSIKILKKQKNNLIVLVVTFVLIVVEIILFTILKEPLKSIQLYDMNLYINNANNILILISSIVLFNIFINMKYRKNEYINLLASSMFGVYLLHSNVVMEYIKKNILEVPNKLIESNTPLIMTLSYTFNVMFVFCYLIV